MSKPFTVSHTSHGATPDWPTITDCCARCRRGTKALQGPCGYLGACRCHGAQLVPSVAEVAETATGGLYGVNGGLA